jgi:DNA polymerase III subunit delta
VSASVYLVTGESFLADEALERIRGEISGDELSETSFDAGSDVTEIMSALETPSLLGGQRLVVVHDVERMKKAELERLERYVADPAPHTVLVLIAAGRTKLAAKVKETGAVISLDPPRGRRLVSWIIERGRTKDIKIDTRAAWTLIDAVGGELREIDSAIEQLSTRLGKGAKVDVGEVRRAFPRYADERIFALTDAVGERRLPVAMAALRRLLEQGDEPLVVLGVLAGHVRRMLAARSHAEAGPATLAGALGMPQWRAEKLHRQVRSFREDELGRAVELLADADVQMKGGDLSPEIALERAVIRIVTGT